jgi:uncharacterized repeat protein (TIGR03803 family)
MRTDSKTISVLPTLIAVWSLLFVGRTAAQTFSNLYNFTGLSGVLSTNGDGANPFDGLIVSDNALYGTASFGGSSSNGTVFALSTDGTSFRTLHSFTASFGAHNTNSDGANPYSGLVLASNTLYGTARSGGNWGNGTVFAVNIDGTGFTTLHSFSATSNSFPSINTNSDGANPWAGMVLSGNKLYGTTRNGGKSGNGTVFTLNTDGTGFTNVHSFTATSISPGSVNTDGANPEGGLVLFSNTLYGTTFQGGASANGTVFALNTDGTGFTNIHSFTRARNQFFTNSDGINPAAVLILSGNTLYGTASSGGGSREGTVFKVSTDGTGFVTLHSFTGSFLNGAPYPGSDGGVPVGGLVLSSNTLYGATQSGGTTNSGFFGGGTVFGLNTDGTGFTTLYRFTAISTNSPYTNSDGAFPYGGLIIAGNTMYGTARGGGIWGSGAIFSLPVSLQSLPEFPPIYAEFTTPTIQTANMTITPGAYFSYNTNFPGSWDIAAVSFGFVGTFDVPATGTYRLTVNHQTSAAASCPGGGYSPVNIYINGTQIASNFDPAQQSGGSLAEVTNSWLISATAGVDNTLKWAAGPLCSRYWIEGIQITPVPAPALSLSVASNNAVLSWGTNLAGFVLESSSSLGGGWSQVSPTPTIVGTTNFATNTITAPLQFYRLHNTGL